MRATQSWARWRWPFFLAASAASSDCFSRSA